MEIEIITTKKKLTLPLLKQMYSLSYKDFDKVDVLGYVSAGRKSTNMLALCRNVTDEDYYLLNMLWERRGHYAGYNYAGTRGEYQMKIDKTIIDEWFIKYRNIVSKAKDKGHIYV